MVPKLDFHFLKMHILQFSWCVLLYNVPYYVAPVASLEQEFGKVNCRSQWLTSITSYV